MKVERLNIQSGGIRWRMLELNEAHKSLLENWKVKVKKVFIKNNRFWVLQKCNANLFEGIYNTWGKTIPTNVAEGIKNQGFSQYGK